MTLFTCDSSIYTVILTIVTSSVISKYTKDLSRVDHNSNINNASSNRTKQRTIYNDVHGDANIPSLRQLFASAQCDYNFMGNANDMVSAVPLTIATKSEEIEMATDCATTQSVLDRISLSCYAHWTKPQQQSSCLSHKDYRNKTSKQYAPSKLKPTHGNHHNINSSNGIVTKPQAYLRRCGNNRTLMTRTTYHKLPSMDHQLPINIGHNAVDDEKLDKMGISSRNNCNGMKQNFTIVTALFNIQRENWTSFQRPFEDYLNYSKQLLHMNVPLLAFVDRSVEEFVRYHRRNKEHLTQIIVSSIHELEYYDDYNVIKEIMDSDEFRDGHAFLNHPEGFSPEYNILMNSKFPMLYEASKLNYFNSTHFYWLDMGYGHNADIYPNQCDWAPKNLMYNTTVGDKITYIQLNPVKWLSNIYEIYKKPVPPFLNGGFFGGSAKAVERYHNVHKEMFKLVLLHRMVDDDQTMAILSVFKERELFNLVDGWWYDAFKLFH